MKIRIKDNSVRLRLTKSEVDAFKLNGQVSAQINFGSTQLTYSLQVYNEPNLTAAFKENKITVFMPKSMQQDWVNTNWVGYDAHMPLNNNQTLFILVEKDFKCLDGTTEDQSDMYENPLADKH